MSIDERYGRYLDHFRSTVTLAEFAKRESDDLIALRHDVDHDLDIALEMAFWEHRRGLKATYFLLHTAPYWTDDRFIEKCLQLQDFGHEVGLHTNVLKEWLSGETADVDARFDELLGQLRTAGVRIQGSAAHGDSDCYRNGYINYWCFRELRGNDPRSREDRLSAEGVPDDDPTFQIPYPHDEHLVRGDGRRFRLWSVSMVGHGLTYEASHLPSDGYYTDSGGSWKRSPDPRFVGLRRGRHQILVHPEYWRGPQRIFFFLSTARSGSKWLVGELKEASSAVARHEFTLNHRWSETGPLPQKVTGAGFAKSVMDGARMERLLLDARACIEEIAEDYAEANVYLVHVLDRLREVFPDAVFVHLYREPYEVLRSMLNRDWYDTPGDDRHPKIDVRGWPSMSQLEKAAWYVRSLNGSLLRRCHLHLRLEEITSDVSKLQDALASVGIAFYPRLGREFDVVVDANTRSEVPPVSEWNEEDRTLAASVLGSIRQELGYSDARGSNPARRWFGDQKRRKTARISVSERPTSTEPVQRIAEIVPGRYRRLVTLGASMEASSNVFTIVPTGDRHAHVMLGGASWNKVEGKQGWSSALASYFRGSLDVEMEGGAAYLFCLMYGDDGSQVAKRALGRLESGTTHFSFRTRPGTKRFDLAVYMPMAESPARLTIAGAFLERVPLETHNDPIGAAMSDRSG